MGSYFFYGPPGTGKTTGACSACDLGWKVHILSADRRIRTQKNLQGWIKEGLLTYEEISAPLSGNTLSQIAEDPLKFIPGRMGHKDKAPEGYMQLCEMIDRHKAEPLPDAHKTILSLDPMSQVNEHLKRLLMYYGKTTKPGFDEWASMLMNYEELFNTFHSLQPEPYAHIVIVSHSHDKDFYITEKHGGKSTQTFDHTETVPYIDGQFKDKAMSLFEEGYYFEVEAFSKQSTPKFKVLTVPVGNVKHARTSRGLKPWVEFNAEQVFGRP